MHHLGSCLVTVTCLLVISPAGARYACPAVQAVRAILFGARGVPVIGDWCCDFFIMINEGPGWLYVADIS